MGHYFLDILYIAGSTVPLDVKVAEDHGKQKAAFYAGISVGQQEVNISLSLIGRLDIMTSSRGKYCSPIGQEQAVPVHFPTHSFSAYLYTIICLLCTTEKSWNIERYTIP